ncbi:hypothetical protein EON66_02745 [archaeon]|nr:MAG: hypothetical protein EON66_02745 [archaeon]
MQKRRRVYPVCSTATDRHCPSRCKRCDFFCEGRVSELAEYGPGITSYFKTLKALAWLLFMMSIITLPMVIINSFGAAPVPSFTSLSLAHTTIGNLGDTINMTRIYLPVTQCGTSPDVSQTSETLQQCSISKPLAAKVYASLDTAAIALFIKRGKFVRRLEKLEDAIWRSRTLKQVCKSA